MIYCDTQLNTIQNFTLANEEITGSAIVQYEVIPHSSRRDK
jgi:hypothetical protein